MVPSGFSHSPSHQGFSLIELLAAVVIVSILAGLLSVGLTGALEKARTTGAMSNMRQIYLGMIAYQSDNGSLPPLTSSITGGPSAQEPFWNQRLIPYIDSGFQVPQEGNLLPKVFYDPAASHNRRRGDFGVLFDNTYGPTRGLEQKSLSTFAVVSASKALLFATAEQSDGQGSMIGAYYFPNNSTTTDGPQRISERHQKKALACFADGAIRKTTKNDLYADKILPFRNQ